MTIFLMMIPYQSCTTKTQQCLLLVIHVLGSEVNWIVLNCFFPTQSNIASKSRAYSREAPFRYSTLDQAPGVNAIKLFSSLLMKRQNKLECLYLAITSQSSLTFAGNTRSLPKKEASERSSNWVCSGLALKFQDLTGKDFEGQTFQLIRPCHQ